VAARTGVNSVQPHIRWVFPMFADHEEAAVESGAGRAERRTLPAIADPSTGCLAGTRRLISGVVEVTRDAHTKSRISCRTSDTRGAFSRIH